MSEQVAKTFEYNTYIEDQLVTLMGPNDEVGVWYQATSAKGLLKNNTRSDMRVSFQYCNDSMREIVLAADTTEFIDLENPTTDNQVLAIRQAAITISTDFGVAFNYDNVCEYNSLNNILISRNTIMVAWDNIDISDGKK